MADASDQFDKDYPTYVAVFESLNLEELVDIALDVVSALMEYLKDLKRHLKSETDEQTRAEIQKVIKLAEHHLDQWDSAISAVLALKLDNDLTVCE